jgi:hypothetical protein
VTLIGGILAICAISAIILARDYAKQNEIDDDFEGAYNALSDDSDEDYFRISRVSSYPANENPKSDVKIAGINSGRGWRLQGHRRSRHMAPWRGQALRQRFAGRLYAFTTVFCSFCLVAVLISGTMVLIFSPHAPVVNVCNTEFDWGSIVNSMKKAQVEADFQILSSIYNPNYLNLVVEGGVAVLRHKHIEVGQMVFEPFTAAGGYTTDVLLIVEIDAEVWKDLMLGYEYELNTLSFFMDATVTASISWRQHKTFPFTFSIKNYFIKVADVTGTDRSLCNCTINS